jgi:hypothetical protein
MTRRVCVCVYRESNPRVCVFGYQATPDQTAPPVRAVPLSCWLGVRGSDERDTIRDAIETWRKVRFCPTRVRVGRDRHGTAVLSPSADVTGIWTFVNQDS